MTQTDFVPLSVAIYSDAPPEIWEGDQGGPESPGHSAAGPLAKLRDEDAAPYARLFAAAPELLAALEYAIIILGRDGIRPLLGEAFTQTDLDQLESAVAKATGR